MLAAAVSVFPGFLTHPDKLQVGAVPGELRQLLAALEFQSLEAADPGLV